MRLNRFFHRMKRLLLVTAAGLFIPLSLSAGPGEQLIVFTPKKGSGVGTYFQKSLLPEIMTVAKGFDLTVSIDEGAAGLPPEVGITPLIVYQNHLGRSVYQGRTTSFKRIKNFIRTSRRVPQGAKKLELNDIPVQPRGKMRLWSPVKISPVSGTPPQTYNEPLFLSSARKAVYQGFTKFRIKKDDSFGRSDRGFYMDFYPWCADDGTLYLSLALFSQFHCKDPVFTLKGEQLKGRWEDRFELFKKAAVLMENAVDKAAADPVSGDGFDSVPADTPVTDWKRLGYALPKPLAGKAFAPPVDLVLPNRWSVPLKHPEGLAAVQFRFPAPLDNYSGEALTVSGFVSFPKENTITGMTGAVVVDTLSVTMGESDLDTAIKGGLFLDSEAYPEASFHIKKVTGSGIIEFGRLAIADVEGMFRLKDKDIPLLLPVTLEPVLDDLGRPSLIITGSFSIDLRDFDIEGATGPEPEKYILIFDLNLALSPK